MNSPLFEGFCHAVCDALGVAAPVLGAADGLAPAFTVAVQGVDITFVQAAPDDAAHAVMLVDYGPMPLDGAAEASRVLLEANFLLGGARPPAFAINPASGHVIYQLPFEVAGADAAAVCADLGRTAGAVMAWREGRFLDTGLHTPGPAVASGSFA